MLQQTGGRAQITLQANQAVATYAAFGTERMYDLTDDAFVVEMPTVPNPASSGAESIIAIYDADNAAFELLVGSGLTRLRKNVGVGPSDVVAPVSYDASAHRFARLREQGGMFIADLSADGTSWTPFGSIADMWDPQYTRFALTAGTYQAATSPGIAAWEGVNVGVGSTAKYCPIDSARSTFTDGTLGPEWMRRFGPSTCDESNGRLTLALPGSMNISCELASRRAFDITGRAVVGELSATTTDGNAQTLFGVAYDNTNSAMISRIGNVMMFEVYVDGLLKHQTPMVSRPAYDPTADRLWRVRHDAGSGAIIAELGTASGTFVELDRFAGPLFPTDAVYMSFRANNFNAAVPGVAELLSINP